MGKDTAALSCEMVMSIALQETGPRTGSTQFMKKMEVAIITEFVRSRDRRH